MATATGPPMSVRALTSGEDRKTLEFAIGGRIEHADVPRLCEQVCARLRVSEASRVVCDLNAVLSTDAVVVEALAYLQLAARRRGCEVAIRHAAPELVELLEFVGLGDVVPVED